MSINRSIASVSCLILCALAALLMQGCADQRVTTDPNPVSQQPQQVNIWMAPSSGQINGQRMTIPTPAGAPAPQGPGPQAAAPVLPPQGQPQGAPQPGFVPQPQLANPNTPASNKVLPFGPAINPNTAVIPLDREKVPHTKLKNCTDQAVAKAMYATIPANQGYPIIVSCAVKLDPVNQPDVVEYRLMAVYANCNGAKSNIQNPYPAHVITVTINGVEEVIPWQAIYGKVGVDPTTGKDVFGWFYGILCN